MVRSMVRTTLNKTGREEKISELSSGCLDQTSTDIDSTANGNTNSLITKQWVEKVNHGGLFLISDSI